MIFIGMVWLSSGFCSLIFFVKRSSSRFSLLSTPMFILFLQWNYYFIDRFRFVLCFMFYFFAILLICCSKHLDVYPLLCVTLYIFDHVFIYAVVARCLDSISNSKNERRRVYVAWNGKPLWSACLWLVFLTTVSCNQKFLSVILKKKRKIMETYCCNYCNVINTMCALFWLQLTFLVSGQILSNLYRKFVMIHDESWVIL